MDNKLTEMAIEMIRFLQKWGLWYNTSIFTNGNSYSYSEDKDQCYHNLPYVEFEEGVDAEELMQAPIEDGGKIVYESYANPEHIFDMIYDGPLLLLARERTYKPDTGYISLEAWDEIFQRTNILVDELYELYGVSSFEKYYEMVKHMSLMEFFDMENDEHIYSDWDPVVYDTWEEYLAANDTFLLEGTDEARLQPISELFDTYASYEEVTERFNHLDKEMLRPFWEKKVETAKKKAINDYYDWELEGMTPYVLQQFDDIFEKYGLWYELCFYWTLTTYRVEDEE
ncbi:MAG: hypothetical protein ACI4WQ_03355 [Sharpea porci]